MIALRLTLDDDVSEFDNSTKRALRRNLARFLRISISNIRVQREGSKVLRIELSESHKAAAGELLAAFDRKDSDLVSSLPLRVRKIERTPTALPHSATHGTRTSENTNTPQAQPIDWRNPGAVLMAAVEALPIVKYAVGVAGITAVVAITTRGFGLERGTAVLGTVIVIVFMVLLLVLAVAARQQRSLRIPALVFTWSFLLMAIGSCALLVMSFFFHVPNSPRCLFYNECNASNQNPTADSMTHVTFERLASPDTLHRGGEGCAMSSERQYAFIYVFDDECRACVDLREAISNLSVPSWFESRTSFWSVDIDDLPKESWGVRFASTVPQYALIDTRTRTIMRRIALLPPNIAAYMLAASIEPHQQPLHVQDEKGFLHIGQNGHILELGGDYSDKFSIGVLLNDDRPSKIIVDNRDEKQTKTLHWNYSPDARSVTWEATYGKGVIEYSQPPPKMQLFSGESDLDGSLDVIKMFKKQASIVMRIDAEYGATRFTFRRDGICRMDGVDLEVARTVGFQNPQTTMSCTTDNLWQFMILSEEQEARIASETLWGLNYFALMKDGFEKIEKNIYSIKSW